jgi:hypothetical protein
MAKANPLHHFLNSVDRAHKHQKSVVLEMTLSIEGQEEANPMTVEFELLPPMDKTTDKTKRNNKK